MDSCQVIDSGESEIGSSCGRNPVHKQDEKQCNMSTQPTASGSKNWRCPQTKSDCHRITTEPAKSVSEDEPYSQNAPSSLCSRYEQNNAVTKSDQYESSGCNHGAKQIGTMSDGSFRCIDRLPQSHHIGDSCLSPDSTVHSVCKQQRNQEVHCNVDCYRDVDMHHHTEGNVGCPQGDVIGTVVVDSEDSQQHPAEDCSVVTKLEITTNTSSEVVTAGTCELRTKTSAGRVTGTEAKPAIVCRGVITDVQKQSAKVDGIASGPQCPGLARQDGRCERSAMLHVVTLEEARLSLLKVIVYLESHPGMGSDYLPLLWQLWNFIEERGRKLQPEDALAVSDVRQEDLQTNLSQVLKQRVEGEDSRKDSFDAGDNRSDSTHLKNGLICKVSEACGLSLRHTRTVEIPEQQRAVVSGKKSKCFGAKISSPSVYMEQESSDEYDESQELCEGNVDTGCEKSDKHLAGCSLEGEVPVLTKQDFRPKRKKQKGCGLLSCSVCGKHFKNPSHLKEHSLTHTSEKPFKCEVCGKGFRRQGYIKQHRMLHTGEKPFPCTLCSKRFRSISELKQHRIVHTGEKPHKCDSCSARFAHAAGLKSHARIHTGDRAFTCNICGAQLAHAGSLKVHVMRAHTREKPYICASCGKAFTTSADLKTHQKTHTGERPYACTICARRFSQCGQLKTHMRTHTGEKPYLCTMCGKGFAHTSSLSVHMRGHTGERPYRCTLCDMRCSDSTNLKKHMRLHMNENLYKCTMCGQSFSQLKGLNKHMTVHISTNNQRYRTHNTELDQNLERYQVDMQSVNNFVNLTTQVYSVDSEMSK